MFVSSKERAPAGWIDVDAALIETHAELARLGATIRPNTQVRGWTAEGGSVAVRTSEGVYHASRLVITAGAWAHELLGELQLPLTIRRKVLTWFEPADSSPRLLHAQVCLYTLTPDENFIIDRHPEHAAVVFAAGFSGHGFKFAPLIGKLLADLSLDGSPAAEFDFLRLAPRYR